MVGIIRESENVSEEEVGTEACLCIATMELVCSLVDSADKKIVKKRKKKKKELMYVTTLLHRADTYTFRSNNRHIKIPRVAGEISSCIDAYQRITQQTLRLCWSVCCRAFPMRASNSPNVRSLWSMQVWTLLSKSAFFRYQHIELGAAALSCCIEDAWRQCLDTPQLLLSFLTISALVEILQLFGLQSMMIRCFWKFGSEFMEVVSPSKGSS